MWEKGDCENWPSIYQSLQNEATCRKCNQQDYFRVKLQQHSIMPVINTLVIKALVQQQTEIFGCNIGRL